MATLPAIPRSSTTRLPESLHCFDTMKENGLLVASHEGSAVLSHNFFEHNLGLKHGTIDYVREMIALGNLLIDAGFYLSERGNRGKGYRLIPVGSIEKQVKHWDRKIISTRCRQIRLSRATITYHGHLLSPEQKLRLQKAEENAARMLAFESNKAATKRIMDAQVEKLRGTLSARAENQIARRLTDSDEDAD